LAAAVGAATLVVGCQSTAPTSRSSDVAGQLFAAAMNPDSPGIDPRLNAAAIANGVPISDVLALNRVYATTHGGVDAPLNAELATATNNYNTTPLYQQRSGLRPE
jgi:hypothetical protein